MTMTLKNAVKENYCPKEYFIPGDGTKRIHNSGKVINPSLWRCLIIILLGSTVLISFFCGCPFNFKHGNPELNELTTSNESYWKQKNYDGVMKKSTFGFEKLTCENTFREVHGPPFKDFRIVCYYVIPSNSTHSRQLPPNFVDPYLCTHIIIGFAGVSNGILDPGPPDVIKVYETIIGFKKMNPSLKVLLSVEDFSSDGSFAKMVSEENLRAKFSSNTLDFLESMNFDGIDLDWEFPAWPASDEAQIKNFTLLLANIRKEIFSHNNNSYILSVAVAAPEAIIDQSYHINDMAGYVDFINLMSYDYHMYTDYLPITGPNSPLFSSLADKGVFQTMNVNWSSIHWNRCGMPLEKINVGIPTYGHSYKLINNDNNGWNAPAGGFGSYGIDGFTSYPIACRLISDPKTNRVFDENYLVPYLFQEKEWISYEDTLSVEYKAKFIKENKFGGAMIFSLNSDDFYGECGTVKFPLLRQIINILSNS